MGNLSEEFEAFLIKKQEESDATRVARPPVPFNIKPRLGNEATLGRMNHVYSNYSEAKDNPLSKAMERVNNARRWVKDNLIDWFPSGVSNCTLTASQWIDPTNPVKNAASIVHDPKKYNYEQIDSASAVPGNMVIAKTPGEESYHTMVISGFAPRDGIYIFDGKKHYYQKGEPMMTYSRGGHDDSAIRRNVPLSVYTAHSDGHTENRFYRYNFPNEVQLPEIIVTPKKKSYFKGGLTI